MNPSPISVSVTSVTRNNDTSISSSTTVRQENTSITGTSAYISPENAQRKIMLLKHLDNYTNVELKPSLVHGVGVFASEKNYEEFQTFLLKRYTK
mmetsp:Transcript_25949/g.38868  ORF Transcript_25949/g.38868 Transcript_25949/m.38868 type:complete len:95 (-) Transcript_25949:388-672(-)